MTFSRIDCLPSGGEGDRRVHALHPVLQETALGEVVDVHIFEADMAAVVRVEHGDDLTHGGTLET